MIQQRADCDSAGNVILSTNFSIPSTAPMYLLDTLLNFAWKNIFINIPVKKYLTGLSSLVLCLTIQSVLSSSSSTSFVFIVHCELAAQLPTLQLPHPNPIQVGGNLVPLSISFGWSRKVCASHSLLIEASSTSISSRDSALLIGKEREYFVLFPAVLDCLSGHFIPCCLCPRLPDAYLTGLFWILGAATV